MSSLFNAATSLVDQARYTSNFLLGTFVLPSKAAQRYLPLPAAPTVKASTLHASDAGGNFTIIVGGTAGIGKELVYAMAIRGADVILACRNVGKGESVRQELLFRAAQTPGTRVNLKIRVAQVDTCDLESVNKFAKGVNSTLAKANKKIRFLFLNAGIARPSSSEKPFTEDGLEKL
jgi:NAD(P)-dependent dehydrogenase (short-subunit alcohol dehydrogenase family)